MANTIWENVGDIGEDAISIVIAGDGMIHIFYNDDDEDWFGHVWGMPGNTAPDPSGAANWVFGQDWSFEPVVEGENGTGGCRWGQSNSAAVGADGTIHVVFSEDCENTLRYWSISP